MSVLAELILVCCATLPLQRSRMCPGVWSGTWVLYSQSDIRGRAVTEWFRHIQVSDGQSWVFLSNWKSLIAKTHLTRWRKCLGFSSTSETWNMFSVTSVFWRLFEKTVPCSRKGGLCLCIFIAVKHEILRKFRIWIKYYYLASAFHN